MRQWKGSLPFCHTLTPKDRISSVILMSSVELKPSQNISNFWTGSEQSHLRYWTHLSCWWKWQHRVCASDTERERTAYKAAKLGWSYNDKHTVSYWTICFPPSSWCYHYFLNPACQACFVNNPPILSRAKVAQQLSDLPAACQERKSQLSGEPDRGNWIAHWGQG